MGGVRGCLELARNRLRLKVVYGRLDRLIVSIERRFEQQDRRDTPCDIRNRARFVHPERAAQDLALAIAEPFLDDLVTADGELPNASRDIFPVGKIVQIHVTGVLSNQDEHLFLGKAKLGGTRGDRFAFLRGVITLDDSRAAKLTTVGSGPTCPTA